jgi:hypothetical protein
MIDRSSFTVSGARSMMWRIDAKPLPASSTASRAPTWRTCATQPATIS